ncbi:BTAD domain-containing putative transcriptional regulator [Streptomyces sp. NPDC005438]|uniref:AfsR/SARP family transcriptional regulator n=1 Tax=Streptomyces sp. NPDC005438 TaxID=3156880 RepID=UPI0033A7DDB5
MRAWRGEEPLRTGSPQQRALLAALLLRGGRIATAQELIDGLWGERPPEQALPTLRTYASRIRKMLAPQSDLLVSESSGYALRSEGLAVDVEEARRLTREARNAVSVGEPERARTLYGQALSLWQGEVLAGVHCPFAETQRARWEEWRLSLVESRLELDLEAGRHAEAITELTALTTEHPLRERLRELLMLALYRGGRQAEALAVYGDTRRLLADELGVDPRPELSELQQRILEADEGLSLAPETVQVVEPTSAVRPRQLPAAVADFTGRDTQLKELGDQLTAPEGAVMAVSAVAGIGGVGKTALAVHVAHLAREHFPDGQLYVDLRGAGPRPAEPEEVLGAFLRALGVPDMSIPKGVEERAALYRSRLAGRRVLALLDNAHDTAQVRPLLPGTAGCAALITSRARLVDLAGAQLVDLDVMGAEEALTLFVRIVGEQRVAGERGAAMEVVAACGFLPLAIRIAAARLSARRNWTVSVLARKLADERRRLDELRVGDQAVKATFEMGYGQLDPAQRRAFRLLGLPDGPDLSLPAAAALLDLSEEGAEDLLEGLVDSSLLESAAPGRYRFHDLVRLYARSCAERDEEPAEREAALDRLLDFYLATATGVYALGRHGERLTEHLAPCARPGLRFEEPDEAVRWLFEEADCFLACARQARTPTALERAVDLLVATSDLAESGVSVRRYEQTALALRSATRDGGDLRTQARIGTMFGLLRLSQGQFEEAEEETRHTMVQARAVEDPIATSYALNLRGIVANYQGRHRDAEEYLNQALASFRSFDDAPSEASVLCNLARSYLGTGRTEQAVELAERAVVIYRRLDVAMRLANGLYALGLALKSAGRLEEAHLHLREALDIFRRSNQRLWEGMTHFRLAEVSLAGASPAQAASQAERALLVLSGIGGRYRHAQVLAVLGTALEGVGHSRRAQACWRDALAIYEDLGSAEAGELRELLSTAVA